MPEQATSPTEVLNNTTDIFRGFSDPSVEEMTDEDTEGGASWEVAGSFPNPANSSHIATSFGDDSHNHHVFSDETFDSSYPLHMVKEGSLESGSKTSKDETSTGTGGGSGRESPRNLQQQPDDTMAVSIASSDTPSINNLGSNAALKSDIMTVLKNAKKKSPSSASAAAAATAGSNAANIKQNPSSSSTGFYPYNIYQSLTKSDNNKKKSPSSSDYLNVEDNNRVLNDSRVTASTVTSSNNSVRSTGGRNNKGGGDREVPSNSSTPPRQHITPPHLSILQDDQGESASMLSDQQSGVLDTSHGGIIMDTNHSIQPYSSTTQGGASYSGRMGMGGGGGGGGGHVGETFSVMSVRSRGTKGKPRYLVRHTLATSQQVNANPATMLKNIFIGIEQERHMHKLAAQNLRAVHNWCLFLPAILLSLLSGVVVFVFEADLGTNGDNIKVYSSIVVGIASLISVFWQALSKQLDLGTRATIHEITASTLKRLSEDIPLTLASTDNIPAEYVALIGEKLAQATDSCPSIVPHKLESSFDLVSDRMVLMLRPPMGQPPRKHVQKIDFMNLYSTAYDELTTEIIHYWAWPFAYPQPRTVSNAALQNFKAIVIEGRERNNKRCSNAESWIRQVLCCGFCSEKKLERSLFDVVPAASVGDNSNAYSTNTKQQHQLQQHNSTPSTNDKQYQQYSYPIRNSMLGSEV